MPLFVWICSRCAAELAPDEVTYTCPRCADENPIAGRLSMVPRFGTATVHDDVATMWRYRDLLPVDYSPAVHRVATCVPVGWTPMHRAARLGAAVGLANLHVKNEAANPTGALKDRASSLVLAAAAQRGEDVVATASSGNAAASLAGVAAATGTRCVTFVPAGTPPAKITQLSVLGARVIIVAGDYDDTVRLCWAACMEWGWYCRSTGVNPFTAEGKKTVALEVIEQLGWQAPDAVVLPVGDGNIIAAVHRGFADAVTMGWIDRMPRLIGVQAATANSVYVAWQRGATDVRAQPAATIADGISVGSPQDGLRALAAVRDTGGAYATVTDEEILGSVHLMASTSGIFPEPSSAAAVAALPTLVADGRLAADELVVVVNTGSGLKAVDRVADVGASVLHTPPELSALANILAPQPV